jgi:hypothetical protein
MLLRSAGVTVVEVLSVPNMNGLNVLEAIMWAITVPVKEGTPSIARVKLSQPDATVRLPMAFVASATKERVVVTDSMFPLLSVTMVKLVLILQTFHVPFINQLIADEGSKAE